jgi:hypothetical protein
MTASDQLEAVEVQPEQRDRLVALDRPVEGFVESLAVGQPGQRVGDDPVPALPQGHQLPQGRGARHRDEPADQAAQRTNWP